MSATYDVVPSLYKALSVIQHRGQESAGISVFNFSSSITHGSSCMSVSFLCRWNRLKELSPPPCMRLPTIYGTVSSMYCIMNSFGAIPISLSTCFASASVLTRTMCCRVSTIIPTLRSATMSTVCALITWLQSCWPIPSRAIRSFISVPDSAPKRLHLPTSRSISNFLLLSFYLLNKPRLIPMRHKAHIYNRLISR